MVAAYNQDLLDRATAYVGQPLTARRYAEGLSDITALYSEITGEPASTCRQCQYSNYLAVVQAYIRQATRELHPETMADSKYSIAPGLENETFVHEGLSEAITAENLTDQAAEFLIGKGFGHAFILKPGHEASAEDSGQADSGPDENAKPTERETQLEQEVAQAKHSISEYQTNYGQAIDSLKKETEAHKGTKEALKTEKKHTATLTKERDELNRQLTEANDKLAKALAPAEPVAPVVDPATAS